MSENEIQFALKNQTEYYLYRLFDLDLDKETANFYIYHGNVEEKFELRPTEYKVFFKESPET